MLLMLFPSRSRQTFNPVTGAQQVILLCVLDARAPFRASQLTSQLFTLHVLLIFVIERFLRDATSSSVRTNTISYSIRCQRISFACCPANHQTLKQIAKRHPVEKKIFLYLFSFCLATNYTAEFQSLSSIAFFNVSSLFNRERNFLSS